MNWPFHDAPDVVVLTTRSVIENNDWIHYVSHDADDGAWQFLSVSGAPDDESDARVVLLRNIIAKDPSLNLIADLPLGWFAWRDTADGHWKRRKQKSEV